jgi:hypothetical protein
MPNIAHSSLTGADLHEAKGTAAAASNTVFVADGAGSGAYAKVPAAAMSAAANPFGAQLLHVQEQQGSGTASQVASTANAWITTLLNTVVTNEIAGASLASGQITLPAGTYYIDSMVAAVNAGQGGNPGQTSYLKPRLFNFTTSAVLFYGRATMLNYNAGTGGYSINQITETSMRGRFVLTGTSVIIIQQFKNFPNNPAAVAQGTEIYGEALIWKTA